MKNKTSKKLGPLSAKQILAIVDKEFPDTGMLLNPVQSDTEPSFVSLELLQVFQEVEVRAQALDGTEDDLLRKASVETTYRGMREVMLAHLSPREEFCLRSVILHEEDPKNTAKRIGVNKELVGALVAKARFRLKHPHYSKAFLGPRRKLVL